MQRSIPALVAAAVGTLWNVGVPKSCWVGVLKDLFCDRLAQEIKLTVFGKLLRDQEPALPLTLRDVDGSLLKENTDPDRALMPRLEGKVLATRSHPLKNYADAEWESEERSLHLKEFSRDAAQARAALAALDPAASVASACPQGVN